jgi:hypothetical protein
MKFLGTSCQRPYAWLYLFEVDNENYAVSSILWDDTQTEDAKLWDIYQLELHKVKSITYNGEWKHMIDAVELGECVRTVKFNFYDVFGNKYKADHYLNDDEAREYLEKENDIIYERVIKPSFSTNQHKGLKDLLEAHLT